MAGPLSRIQHQTLEEQKRAQEHKELQSTYRFLSKKEIAAQYTDAYIADLLQRAAVKSPKLTDLELGYS